MQIYNRYQSQEITTNQFWMQTGVNIGTTGTVSYLGAGGLQIGATTLTEAGLPLIAGCASICWTIAGVTSLAYVAPIGQETANNMIEGQPFVPAFLDARAGFHDKVFGNGANDKIDGFLNEWVLPVLQAAGDGIIWLGN